VPGTESAPPGEDADALLRATHRTIAGVTEALETFAFNVAVARIYEFAGTIADADKAGRSGAAGMAAALRGAAEIIARLVAPMMPHLAEEVYHRLCPDEARLVAELPWPESDPALVAAQSVTIAVQVMGKLRGTVIFPPDAPADEVLAAAEQEPNVARLLEGKRVVKRIHVPNRIVNFVVAG